MALFRSMQASFGKFRAPSEISWFRVLLVIAVTAQLFWLMFPSGQVSAAPNVSIVLASNPALTLDSNKPCVQGPDAGYVAYLITNNTATAMPDLTVTISGLTGGFSLAGGQTATQTISLAANASETVYWYIQYPCTAALTDTPTVTVTDGTGTTTGPTGFGTPGVYPQTSTLTTTSELSAQAGGTLVSTTVGAGAVLGQIITVDIVYSFGNIASGDVMSFQPAGNTTWNAGCFQLITDTVTASAINAVPNGTTDKLYYVSSASQTGTGHDVTVRFYFRYLCAGTSSGSTAQPYSEGGSGTQQKYSGPSQGYDICGDSCKPLPSAGTLTITKFANPTSLPTGGTATFTIVITNATVYTATLDSISDTLPTGETYTGLSSGASCTSTTSTVTASDLASAPANPTSGPGTITWVGTPASHTAPPVAGLTIAANSTLGLCYTATVSSTVGSYTDSATASVGSTSIGPATATVTVGTQATITKAFSPSQIGAGQNSIITFQLSNSNASALTGASFTDTLSNMSISGNQTVGGTCSGTTPSSLTGGTTSLSFTGITIPPSSSCTVTVVVTSSTVGTNPNSTSGVTTTQITTAGTGSGTVNLTVLANPTVAKSFSPNPIAAGGTSTLTITLSNTNGVALTGAAFTDTYPSGLTNSGTPGGTTTCLGGTVMAAANGPSVALSGGSIPANGSCTVTVQVTAASAGSYINTIKAGDVTTGNGGSNTSPASGTLTVTPPQADLAVTKTVDKATPNVGDTITFTVSVTNNGPNDATTVTISDPIPTGFTFASATPSQGSYVSGTGVWTVGTITNGATVTLAITGTVTSAGLPNFTNTASVSHSDQTDPNSANNSASSTVTPLSADLAVTKIVDNAAPNVGGNVTFTVSVKNNGPSTATNVTIQDLLPAGLTFVSSTSSQGSYVSGTGVWTVGTIANGVTVTLQITATVVSPTSQTNTASVSHSDQFDPNTANNSASSTVTPQQADLAVTKIVDNATPNVGGNVTFTVSVTNNGPSTATNVTIQDLLPAGLTFVSSTSSQGSYVSGTGVWTVGTIANGVTVTLQITATVVSPTSQTNTASVSHSDQFDPNTANNTASSTVTPQQADLAVTKIVDNATPNVGGNVTFTVSVTNNGPSTATNVTIQDTLPTGFSLVTATPSQGSYVSGTGVWTVGTIANGATVTLTLNGTVTSAGLPNFTNTASVSHSDQFDPNTGNNTASVTVTPAAQADLAVTKIVDNATPNVGDTIHFTVSVTNNGPSTATNVTIQDLLPAGLTFVSSTSSQGSYVSGTGVWTVGTIANGNTATLQITATVVSPTSQTNTASVSHSDQTDPTPGNNSASSTVTPQQADLAVTKTVDNATPNVGGTINFTVSVKNNGPSTATNVTIQDLLPAGLTFVSSTPSQGSYVSGTGVWTVGTIANGVTVTLQITATVVSPTSQTNTASVSHSDQFDPNTANNSASSTVTPAGATNPPTISKVFSPNPVKVNTASTLTFTITNPNAGTALNGIAFSDTLPAGLHINTPPNASTSCAGGTVSAPAGGTVITLTGGPSLAANASCTAQVDVSSVTGSVYNNVSGAVSSTNGGTGNTAIASLTVLAPPTISKSFTPNSIPLNGTSTLTFTVGNPNSTTALTGVQFTDTFPANLVVATPLTQSTTCAGGTVNATAGGNSVGLTNASLPANSTCTVTIQVQGTGAGTLTNTTGAISSTNGGTGSTATATITVSPANSLTVSKAFAPNPIATNGVSVLTITITNPSATAVTAASMTDTLPTTPANMVVANPTGAATTCGTGVAVAAPGGNTIALSNGTIPASGSCTLSVNVTAPAAGTYVNTIPAGAILSQSGTTNANPATGSLVVGAPPSAAKSFTPNTIPANGVTTLTLTITNPNATVALTGVTITDVFPGGMTVATTPNLSNTCGGTPAGGTAGANNLGLTGGTIAAGGSCAISVNVTAGATATNTSGTVSSTNTGNGNTASATLNVVNGLTLAKGFNPTTIPTGGISTLTFTITNPTNNPLTALAFADTFPANLVIASAPNLTNTCGGTISGGAAGNNNVGLSGGSLNANSTCFISVNVTTTVAGTYNNTSGAVTANSAGAPLTGNQASASLTAYAGLNMVKAFNPSQIAATGTSTLTFTITNGNATPIDGLAFNDTLPGGLLIAPAPNVQNTCGGATTGGVAGGNTIGLSAGSLAAHAACTVNVNVGSTGANTYTNVSGPVSSNQTGIGNTARAVLVAGSPSSASPTPSGNNNNNNNIVVVVDPVITKMVDVQLALPGDPVTWTIIVTNKGNAAATGVVVTDPVPSQLQILNVATTQGSSTVNGNTVVFTIGTVNSGQSVTMQVFTKVRSSVVPPIDVVNTAYEFYNEGPARSSSAPFGVRSASASIRITRGELPATGEHPDDSAGPSGALPMTIAGLIALVVAGGVLYLRRKRS